MKNNKITRKDLVFFYQQNKSIQDKPNSLQYRFAMDAKVSWREFLKDYREKGRKFLEIFQKLPRDSILRYQKASIARKILFNWCKKIPNYPIERFDEIFKTCVEIPMYLAQKINPQSTGCIAKIKENPEKIYDICIVEIGVFDKMSLDYDFESCFDFENDDDDELQTSIIDFLCQEYDREDILQDYKASKHP